MNSPLTARRGGPVWATALDVLRWAWHSRALFLLLLILLVLLAVVIAGAGQVVVPWLIYGGL